MKWPVELHFFIRMTLKTGGHIFFGIKNVPFAAAGVNVKTGGAVAHLTSLDFKAFAGNAHTLVG